MPLARQLSHQRFVHPGPLVLGIALLKSPARAADRDRHICYHIIGSSLPDDGARSFLPGSACRHAGRTISSRISLDEIGVRRMVSEGSGPVRIQSSLLIVRTHTLSLPIGWRVVGDARSFQHIAEFIDSAVNFTVSRRSKPSSRATLMGEQPNPWNLLQLQDVTSRHRGAKPCRRYELLGKISLLSPGYLLSVERRPIHIESPDH